MFGTFLFSESQTQFVVMYACSSNSQCLVFAIGYMPQTSMYTPGSVGPFTPTQQQAAGYAGPAAGSFIGTSAPSANLSSGFGR